MREFINDYIWFIKESANYLTKPIWYITLVGQVKAIKHALYMHKWARMTPEQHMSWYVNENGLVEFEV